MNVLTLNRFGKGKGGKGRRDYRVGAFVLVFLGTAVLGYVVSLWPERGVQAVVEATLPAAKPAGFSDLPQTSTDATPAPQKESLFVPTERPQMTPAHGQRTETEKILQASKKLLNAKKYDAAITTLNQERDRIKDDPRSYVSMAQALEGKRDYDTARDFYYAAIDKDPYLAEAYYGFATTSEALGDLEAALGGMRNFLHVQPNADPQKLRIAQAKSAIWEWEARLGRGPYDKTKGIPPGFSEAELKRDGRGVGIKIPLPETRTADGWTKYEIKAQDKFQIFKP